jgi:hypothetical protein
LLVADPIGNVSPISEAAARADLANAWRGRVRDMDEVITNLFLAGFDTEGDMLSVIRG